MHFSGSHEYLLSEVCHNLKEAEHRCNEIILPRLPTKVPIPTQLSVPTSRSSKCPNKMVKQVAQDETIGSQI